MVIVIESHEYSVSLGTVSCRLRYVTVSICQWFLGRSSFIFTAEMIVGVIIMVDNCG